MDLTDLLKTSWKVYRVSPLYNFQESKIRSYAKKLAEELVAANTYRSNNIFRSEFRIRPDVKPIDVGLDGIEVHIWMNNQKQVYHGFFLNWESERQVNNPKSMSLPILIVQSQARIRSQVHKILCKFFDCDIQPVQFSSKDLIVLFMSLLNTISEDCYDGSSLVSLMYSIPGCGLNDIITITLSMEETAQISSMLIKEHMHANKNIMESELIGILYFQLLTHIFNVYQVDFLPAELSKIILLHSKIHSSGQINWSSQEIAHATLIILQKFMHIEHVMSSSM